MALSNAERQKRWRKKHRPHDALKRLKTAQERIAELEAELMEAIMRAKGISPVKARGKR